MDIAVEREEDHRVCVRVELHSEGCEVPGVEVEGVAGCYVDGFGFVDTANFGDGLVACRGGTFGLYGEGLGFPEGDGWDAIGEMDLEGLLLADFITETEDFAGCEGGFSGG